jgi:N-carbamoylputrescine amidase
MKVTVCQLPNDPAHFVAAFDALAIHVQAAGSDLVLLPEMPFSRWFTVSRPGDGRSPNGIWREAEAAHDAGMAQLAALAPSIVASTRPVTQRGIPLNEGFVWSAASGYAPAHHKYYLPEEDGFWEASWYERGDGTFNPIDTGAASLGFLICSELWFFERARAYGKAGSHMLLTPRCTEAASVETWLTGGRAAAISAGAFSLSSNRVGSDDKNTYGGGGWIIAPDGEVLAVTNEQQPFLTVDIDLAQAQAAKQTYPRYIQE